MAGLGGKNWAFEEEVTSSDVNGFLADQVVMRFADEATRTAGFGGAGEPTLAEGMVSYLDDANRVEVYNGSAWKPVSQILQVVSTIKTDTFTSATTSQGAETDITGLSATITPSSSSSKILVMANVTGSTLGTALALAPLVIYKVYRGATAIGIGDAAGNRSRVSTYAGNFAVNQGMGNGVSIILDSPNTTSATTYKCTFVNAIGSNATAVMYLNQGNPDDNNNYNARAASSITLMEVAG